MKINKNKYSLSTYEDENFQKTINISAQSRLDKCIIKSLDIMYEIYNKKDININLNHFMLYKDCKIEKVMLFIQLPVKNIEDLEIFENCIIENLVDNRYALESDTKKNKLNDQYPRELIHNTIFKTSIIKNDILL